MMPMFATVRIRNETGRNFTLWLPLLLVWVVLAPFAVLILPLAAILLAAKRIDPAKAFTAIIVLLCSLSGMLIEVQSPKSSFLVRIE
jgi:hypothetical protein